MKRGFSRVVFFIGAILMLSGCQSVAPKKAVSVISAKCAPIHNLSQEKRKACTDKAVIHTAALDN